MESMRTSSDTARATPAPGAGRPALRLMGREFYLCDNLIKRSRRRSPITLRELMAPAISRRTPRRVNHARIQSYKKILMAASSFGVRRPNLSSELCCSPLKSSDLAGNPKAESFSENGEGKKLRVLSNIVIGVLWARDGGAGGRLRQLSVSAPLPPCRAFFFPSVNSLYSNGNNFTAEHFPSRLSRSPAHDCVIAR
ncbi:hypothetical protein EVAR_60842_1 [Eumeta japonica]|uniref:Uncharacterized protein n=1 Tax=Eumeta variegata TaxID=151549 RepID=A0A4C1Y9S0_EUMVA|nr:hypothetical protein EVAR_60842_1 [Eumeta japonica]